jgi:hypothetical protein
MPNRAFGSLPRRSSSAPETIVVFCGCRSLVGLHPRIRLPDLACGQPQRFCRRPYAFDTASAVHWRSSPGPAPDELTARLFLPRSPQELCTHAAAGGVEPGPATRLRRANYHLLCSTTLPGILPPFRAFVAHCRRRSARSGATGRSDPDAPGAGAGAEAPAPLPGHRAAWPVESRPRRSDTRGCAVAGGRGCTHAAAVVRHTGPVD